eukprot:952871-Pleurochrysis_carterae.AAC.1
MNFDDASTLQCCKGVRPDHSYSKTQIIYKVNAIPQHRILVRVQTDCLKIHSRGIITAYMERDGFFRCRAAQWPPPPTKANRMGAAAVYSLTIIRLTVLRQCVGRGKP